MSARESKPSRAAVSAAVSAAVQWLAGFPGPTSPEEASLQAAHSPELGLDRSVRLGDIVELLEGLGRIHPCPRECAELIKREFT